MTNEEYNRNVAKSIYEETIGQMPLSLRFDQIAIVQKKNMCKSRLDADIKSEVIRDIILDVPILASNMHFTSSSFCIKLSELGAMGVMHRIGGEEDILSEIILIANKGCKNVAASVGIGNGQFEFARKLVEAGANILFIDIAHGYSDEVIEFGKILKKELPIKIILGNTTNLNMLYEVADFADGLKIGIAQGFACQTSNTAGSTEGQFTAVLKFKEESQRLGIPIISDGSVKEGADFSKAISSGANSIMCGKIFAMCPESNAEVLEISGVKKKIYAGSASRYIQNRWRGGLKDGTCPEGKVCHLDIGESVDKLLERYAGALRSGITYGGGTDVKSFQDNVEFIRIM